MYASRRNRRYRQRRLFVLGAVVVVVLVLLLTLYSAFGSSGTTGAQDPTPDTPMNDQLADPTLGEGDGGSGQEASVPSGDEPEEVRAIYLTSRNARNPAPFLDLLDRTEANAVVVDVKDVTGEVMYRSEVPLAQEIGATRNILDLPSLTEDLRERDVYSIARVAIFEDDILPVERPDLAATDSSTGAQWTNNVGNYWSDPYSREVWEYNVAIAKEAAEAGFDEIQFDYVRFPSDGPMETLTFPAAPENEPEDANTVADFLAYADEELEPTGAKLAADVFGLAAGDNGAGVGQDIPNFAPHLDVICPMVYPSHYPVGTYGLEDPNSEPYAVLENSLAEFEEDVAQTNPDVEIRPWLQDFTYGTPPYGPDEVRAQIEATYDSGSTGWLLWNADNVYTEAAISDEPGAASAQYEETTSP